jgi:hypothetical protein
MTEDYLPRRKCCRCGKRMRLILKLFDPLKDREVWLYQCQCGKLAWQD